MTLEAIPLHLSEAPMTDYQVARSIVEKLTGHLSAGATGAARPEADLAAEHLRHLVSDAVDDSAWQPFERAPGDPATGERLVDALTGALGRDPGLAPRLRQATAPPSAPVDTPVPDPGPAPAPGRDPFTVIAVCAVALALLAAVVYGTNALLGSDSEEEAENAARDFVLASVTGDTPRVCALSTPAVREGVDCAAREHVLPPSDVDDYGALISGIMDVTAYLREDDTASVTCVLRWTLEDARRAQEFTVRAGGTAEPLGPFLNKDTVMRLELRESGDGWFVTRFDIDP